MRWSSAAWIAVVAVAGIPAVSDAAQPNGMAMLHVSVTPRTGSTHTRFAISFRAAATTGTSGGVRHAYSVTARGPKGGGCQWIATTDAPPSKAGTHVRVVLSPGGSRHWCTGTFSGTVWDIITVACPGVNGCPAALAPSSMIGKFTFRVS
jgi:hypothetical protein